MKLDTKRLAVGVSDVLQTLGYANNVKGDSINIGRCTGKQAGSWWVRWVEMNDKTHKWESCKLVLGLHDGMHNGVERKPLKPAE